MSLFVRESEKLFYEEPLNESDADLPSDAVVDLTKNQLEGIRRAVQDYARLHLSGSSIAPDSYAMLAGRALVGMGKISAARRLAAIGSGVVQLEEWSFCGDLSVWAIDFKKIIETLDITMEIPLFSALNAIIDSLGEVWDTVDGEGFLGLKNIDNVSDRLTFSRKRNSSKKNISKELVDYCISKLSALASSRDWKHVPTVVCLEI